MRGVSGGAGQLAVGEGEPDLRLAGLVIRHLRPVVEGGRGVERGEGVEGGDGCGEGGGSLLLTPSSSAAPSK
jgi:hypothetical protein